MRIFKFLPFLMILPAISIGSEGIKLLPVYENAHVIGIAKNDPLGVKLKYSGSGIAFSFTGNHVQIIVNGENQEQNQPNYLGIELNHVFSDKRRIDPNLDTLTVFNPTPTRSCKVKIFKLTEAMVGTVCCMTFLAEDSIGIQPLDPDAKKILWIGNSLTCGYGNERSISPPPSGNPSTGFHSKNENNYWSWSSITSRAIKAEAAQLCWSGKGIYRNYDGSDSLTLPKLFQQEIEPNKEVKILHPDLIVINLGTNDFGPEMRDTSNKVDSAKFVSTYLAFIKTLNRNFPEAYIIAVIGNALSDQFPSGAFRLSRCRSYIKTVMDLVNSPQVLSFELPTQKGPYGEDWHPNMTTHLEMSHLITSFIRKNLNW